MALAPLSAIVKPPVLYSFPSEITWHKGRVFGLKAGPFGVAVPDWLEVRWSEGGRFQVSVKGVWSPETKVSYNDFDALTKEVDLWR